VRVRLPIDFYVVLMVSDGLVVADYFGVLEFWHFSVMQVCRQAPLILTDGTWGNSAWLQGLFRRHSNFVGILTSGRVEGSSAVGVGCSGDRGLIAGFLFGQPCCCGMVRSGW
jgi:hypothetical protein